MKIGRIYNSEYSGDTGLPEWHALKLKKSIQPLNLLPDLRGQHAPVYPDEAIGFDCQDSTHILIGYRIVIVSKSDMGHGINLSLLYLKELIPSAGK